MINGKTVLVTICARGGSKGIPHKNLKMLGGKPLLAWTIDLLPQLKYMDNWVLSSDATEYFNIITRLHEPFTSNGYGHERPKELANDTVSRVEAVKEAVIATEKKFHAHYDIIVDLGVATPFKTAADVNHCIEKYAGASRNCDRLTTVTPCHNNPYFSQIQMDDEEWTFRPCDALYYVPARQLAPKVFDMNDAVNVWTRGSLFDNPNTVTGIYLHQMPPERSVHLDSPLDWAFAEFLLEKAYIQPQ